MAQGENDRHGEPAGSPAQDGVADAPELLSQADLMSGPGLRGALFAQWARQKRRNAIQQRYGEEADSLLDDTGGIDLDDWTD